MLYHLLYPLRDHFFGFNVFRYLTFRAAGAAFTAFLISVVLGRPIIKMLKRMKIRASVYRQDCPGLYPYHRDKDGVPTMGGILILLAIVSSTLLWADLTNRYVHLVLISTCWLGMVGFLDDWIKLRSNSSSGLSARAKFYGQIIIGLALGTYLYLTSFSTRLEVPFVKSVVIELGFFYVFFVCLVIVGSANAVNLTDGLDGLAIGSVTMVALTYAGLSYIAGHAKFSHYLQITSVPGSGEVAVFCAGVAGAGLGFLWFNSHPATVFMGDTGSMALGGAVGTVSVLIKKELLLLIVGGLFVVEALSVIIQVGSCRLRKKRVFLVAPLHHHFQMRGWAESKIIVRFWIVAAVLALIGLTTLKIR